MTDSRLPLPEPHRIEILSRWHEGPAMVVTRFSADQMHAYADDTIRKWRNECRGDDCGELASLKDSYGQLLAALARKELEATE